jgi:hypothetical protein
VLKPATLTEVTNGSRLLAEEALGTGKEKVARAYLEFLYRDKGQGIATERSFRPRNPTMRLIFRFLPSLGNGRWPAVGRPKGICLGPLSLAGPTGKTPSAL